jgi:hypothetical protein
MGQYNRIPPFEDGLEITLGGRPVVSMGTV